MARINIDVDGICANFTDPVISLVNSLGGYNYTSEDIRDWDIKSVLNLTEDEWAEVLTLIQTEGFAASLAVFPHTKEFIADHKDEHEIRFLTSDWRGSKTWVYDRNHWLVRQFGSVGKQVHHTSYKEDVRGDVVIEDRYSNAVKWKQAWPDKVAMIWDRPWNASQAHDDTANGLVRVYSWVQVAQIVAKL